MLDRFNIQCKGETNSVCILSDLQLEDKRVEMERQLISMKVQYQSLQKQHAFSKQQLQRMKVPWFEERKHRLRSARCCLCVVWMTAWLCMCCAGPDSHSDADPGIQGWSGSVGETPVHVVWEKWRDPKPNDQTAKAGEGRGESLKATCQKANDLCWWTKKP